MDNDDNNGGVQLSQLSDAEVNGYSEQIKNYIKNADNNGDIIKNISVQIFSADLSIRENIKQTVFQIAKIHFGDHDDKIQQILQESDKSMEKTTPRQTAARRWAQLNAFKRAINITLTRLDSGVAVSCTINCCDHNLK